MSKTKNELIWKSSNIFFLILFTFALEKISESIIFTCIFQFQSHVYLYFLNWLANLYRCNGWKNYNTYIIKRMS